jgi:rod shape-determining protein MreB
MGIMSMNGIVISSSIRVAGMNITESIINYVKKQYQLLIGFNMAEIIKTQIGNSTKVDSKEQKELEVRGRDATTSMPKNIILKTNDIVDAIRPVIVSVNGMIKQVMEKTPPELSSDIVDAGILMCGGTAALPNIAVLITKNIGVSFFPSEEPSMVVSKGMQKLISNPDAYTVFK